MRILVIGGGIGGLTVTVALRRAGFDAHVYEQTPALGEVGAGLVLRPNAVRVLDGLGFGEALSRIGMVPDVQESRHWQTGEVLARTAGVGEALRERYGFPSYMCHRAEAHAVVWSGVPDEAITLDAKCVAIEDDGRQVTARFADGRSASGDLLIGADGAGSMVRAYVIGPDAPVRPSKVAWRGLAPGEVDRQIGLKQGGLVFRGQGKFFLVYYVASLKYVNWIAIMNPDGDLSEPTGFVPGGREAALADFAGWAPDVQALIASTDQVSRWVLYDGEPLPAWSRGRVTLLGDAAHPMLPFAAQGAGQSIEDAVILARCIERTPDDLDGALRSYFATRWERASAVQAGGRASASVTLQKNYESVPQQRDQDWINRYDALHAPLAD